jgi:hypothetical protein
MQQSNTWRSDGGLGTSRSADGNAVGDARVGEEGEGGEAKADGRGNCGVVVGDRTFSI